MENGFSNVPLFSLTLHESFTNMLFLLCSTVVTGPKIKLCCWFPHPQAMKRFTVFLKKKKKTLTSSLKKKKNSLN